MIVRGVIFLVLLSAGLIGTSQDRCGIPTQSSLQEEAFENWMRNKQFEKFFQLSIEKNQAEVYLLPVVVHVIHNGEILGMGGNLTDEKIQEQIDVLNADFRRMNADAANTPGTFQSIAADIEVEFVLAKQDSNGNVTNGIVRKQGSQESYTLFSDDVLKTESYWPAEDYINIWVAQINFLGWASFPETSLSGINSPETNRLFDGVVIDADWWGLNNNTGGSFDSYGQTLTHEVGHFLGLRHIWGDGVCSASDYCDDTPPAISDHGGEGSPCSYPGPNTCHQDIPDVADMYMNYMDYTNDECMNLFTLDQKTRIRTVLENSPRRLSLRTSLGKEEPTVFDLDLAIDGIGNVPIITCINDISPSVSLRNFGFDEISSFKLAYSVEGNERIITESNLSIASGSTYNLTVDVTGLSEGLNEIAWEIKEVNGLSDEDATNNLSLSNLDVRTDVFQAPFEETFSQNSWNTSSQGSEWSIKSIGSNTTASVEAFENNTSLESWLVTPIFDMSSFDEAGLFFRMSYGIRFTFSDWLEVKISTSCSEEFETIWSNDLGDLNFPGSLTAWVPTSDEDWQDEFVSLDNYAGFSEVRLAFVFTNNGGNDLYLDDIKLTNNGDPSQPRLPFGKFIAYPSPAKQSFNITLSLPEFQPIRVRMIDMSGSIVMDLKYENILNHTLSITPKNYGMYYLVVSGKDINQTQRILISR